MQVLITIFFSFLIALTIAIDTLGLIMKSSSGGGENTATAFTGANILSYISRASVIIIMPLLGLILDEKIEINFLSLLIFLVLINSILVGLALAKFEVIISISKKSVGKLKYGIFPFLKYYLKILVVSSDSQPISFSKPIIPLIIVYSVQYSIFPIIIFLGFYFSDFKTTALSLYGAITGVFTIYLVAVVERKLAIKIDNSAKEAKSFCKTIIVSKLYACIGVLPIIFVYLYSYFPMIN